MTTSENAVNEADKKTVSRRVVVARLLMLWVFLVTIYFLWEASNYRGLYAFLSEVQFEQFGHYLPILTFSGLVLLFSSPAAWLFRARRRADKADIADPAGPDAAILTASNFRRILFGFAGGLGAAAIFTLLWSLTLPVMAPPRQTIVIGDPRTGTPERGPTLLKGDILYIRTSAFTQDLFVTRRGVRFAPIFPYGSHDRNIDYFVELLPSDLARAKADQAPVAKSGILMRSDLPGSIVRLYRYAGYRVDRPFYVLYASELTMRWPYYVTAVQLGIAALLALLAALFQHRHVRQVRQDPAPA